MVRNSPTKRKAARRSDRDSSGASKQQQSASTLGAIQPGELYPLRVACERLGWKDAALRAARRRGLRVRRSGNLYFVLGKELIDFLVSSQGKRTLSLNQAKTDSPWRLARAVGGGAYRERAGVAGLGFEVRVELSVIGRNFRGQGAAAVPEHPDSGFLCSSSTAQGHLQCIE